MLNGYEKLKTVGKGSFGTAVLYKRLNDNKPVVVKEIVTADMNEDEKMSALNEVNILSTLNHSNIIRYIDSFENEGSLIIIMEYADGGNLAQLVNIKKKKRNIFTERGILNIISQISNALSYMHSRKILHRDLKTANVFISLNGIIKIGDFGISKMLNTKSRAETVIGTPFYLSPEMCEGEEYNEKSDIWAMGCILYELATFKKPFNAQTLPALVQKISACEYEDIPKFYSEDLSSLINFILQKNPEARPTANQIHGDIIPKITEKYNLNVKLDSPFYQRNSWERSVMYQIKDFDNWTINPLELPHKKIIDFSVSSSHNLVVTADNIVYGWGENNFGEIASRNADIVIKYPVCADFLKNQPIVKCAAGLKFSLFLNSHGKVLSCGNGTSGCLGHGDNNNVSQPTTINTLISSIVSNICCGVHHVVAITTEGKVYTWGLSKYGELGQGPIIRQRSKPFQINLPLKMKQAYCSEDATVLVDPTGKVLVAGNNKFQKLGVPQQGNINTFHVFAHTYGAIKNISLNSNHTVMINEKGDIITMGKNSELHNNFQPIVINLDRTITKAACGPTFTVAMDNQNVIWFWGSYQKAIGQELHKSYATEKSFTHKYNTVLSLSQNNFTIEKQLSSANFQTIDIENPKSILALYSFDKNAETENIIYCGDVEVTPNSIMVLIHTSVPPPLKTFNDHTSRNTDSVLQTRTDYSSLRIDRSQEEDTKNIF